ncbi:hypothetical protein BDN70DRAFT_819934, partial [Pholiota conissans]
IFISFFFKIPKRKKSVKIAAGARAAAFRRPGENSTPDDDDDEATLEEGDNFPSGPDDIAIEEEADATLEAEEEDHDEGKLVHNKRVVKTLREKAIQLMAEKGIVMDPEEERIALQIFPRVCGLGRKVHDVGHLTERFKNMVSDDPEVAGTQRTLTRRVATRWNSDLKCLDAHFFFRNIVEQLTAIESLKLRAYQLSDDQWKMSEDVNEVLLLFDEPTRIFSTAETPLIVDVIPALEEAREGLIAARDDEEHDLSNIVRIACQASILLIDKYSTFTNFDCDIYVIAIAMCPDRKMKWFKDHGRSRAQITAIEKRVIAKWNKFYATDESLRVDEEPSSLDQTVCFLFNIAHI